MGTQIAATLPPTEADGAGGSDSDETTDGFPPRRGSRETDEDEIDDVTPRGEGEEEEPGSAAVETPETDDVSIVNETLERCEEEEEEESAGVRLINEGDDETHADAGRRQDDDDVCNAAVDHGDLEAPAASLERAAFATSARPSITADGKAAAGGESGNDDPLDDGSSIADDDLEVGSGKRSAVDCAKMDAVVVSTEGTASDAARASASGSDCEPAAASAAAASIAAASAASAASDASTAASTAFTAAAFAASAASAAIFAAAGAGAGVGAGVAAASAFASVDVSSAVAATGANAVVTAAFDADASTAGDLCAAVDTDASTAGGLPAAPTTP